VRRGPQGDLADASWYRLGMGFSSDTVGGDNETLFVTGTGMTGMSNSPGVGKIDMSTSNLVPCPGNSAATPRSPARARS